MNLDSRLALKDLKLDMRPGFEVSGRNAKLDIKGFRLNSRLDFKDY